MGLELGPTGPGPHLFQVGSSHHGGTNRSHQIRPILTRRIDSLQDRPGLGYFRGTRDQKRHRLFVGKRTGLHPDSGAIISKHDGLPVIGGRLNGLHLFGRGIAGPN
jgi:hypothetical protein